MVLVTDMALDYTGNWADTFSSQCWLLTGLLVADGLFDLDDAYLEHLVEQGGWSLFCMVEECA